MITTKRNISIAKMERVAELLKTIGHPLRLQVMEILEQEEPLSVSEILSRLNDSTEQSLLSHHLIKMKDKGIIQCEKQGMNVYYRLLDRSILKIFDCLETCELAEPKK